MVSNHYVKVLIENSRLTYNTTFLASCDRRVFPYHSILLSIGC
jgi:hypothetical protein